MISKIQEFQVNFMEIIDDIADYIPNDKYVDLCRELKDNYSNFEKIQNKIHDLESREEIKIIHDLERRNEELEEMIGRAGKSMVIAEKFKLYTRGFMDYLNITDIFADGMREAEEGNTIAIPVKEIRRRIKKMRCCEEGCKDCIYDSSDDEDDKDDYKTKYKQLVERIKKTSKNQLQKLKNEL